jgi:hypothetical protein
MNPARGIYWRMDGWRCSTGLAASDVTCARARQEVGGSTRRDDSWQSCPKETRRMRLTRLVPAVVALVLASLRLAAIAAATAQPLGFDGQHLRRDPGLIVYSADGGAFLAGRGSTYSKLHWTQ